MADKKRGKKRRDEYTGPGGAPEVVEKPTKDEYSVAKWLRRNVPTKKTKFANHNVEYFTSSKALDALMSSKWAEGAEPLLGTREIAIDFMESLLRHKFFHRAVKVPVSEQELKGRKKGDKDKDKEQVVAKDKEDEKKLKSRKGGGKETGGTDAESSHVEGKEKAPVEKEKRKRKIRLDMHNQQLFIDGPEAYVWIYDPIPFHYWLCGALLVLGAIGLCLFPLWPPSVRKGVYYLSLAAAGFLVFIIALAVVRVIVFCFVWAVSFSKHHLWLFPNLTEDVGFFASFWPLYQYEYRDGTSSATNKKKNKKKKDKDSDNEEEPAAIETPPSPKAEKKEIPKESPKVPDPIPESKVESEPKVADLLQQPEAEAEPSESESESSQRSSTGRDFEMVDPNDVDTS